MDTITVTATIHAPVEKVWEYYTAPDHIVKWNAASDDWHSTSSTNDLRGGGSFVTRMEAKDGSAGFDFGGTYTDVISNEKIAYTMGDTRSVVVTFQAEGDHTVVTTVFDPETQNPAEMQRAGWQAILNNFKTYVEAH